MSENNIDTLSIQIDSVTKSAENGLDKLKGSLNKVADIIKAINRLKAPNGEKIKTLTSQIELLAKNNFAQNLSRHFKNFDDEAANAQITSISDLTAAISRLARAGVDARIDMLITKLQTFNSYDFGNLVTTAGQIDKLTDSITRLAKANKSVKILDAFFKATKGSTSKKKTKEKQKPEELQPPDTSQFTDFLQQLGDMAVSYMSQFGTTTSLAMVSAFNTGFVAIYKTAETGFKLLATYVNKKFISPVKNAIKLWKEFLGSLGRIAMYRSIRFLLSEFAEAIREGTKNLYEYSKAVNGVFVISMDRAASSFLYLKNSIAASVSPLVNAFVPAIELVIDKIVELINYVNQLLSLISGATSWTKAVKTQTKFADSVSNSASAVKEFSMGFDELNVISDSGGGATASIPDYGSMFETLPLDVAPNSWLGEFKTKIDAGDWAGVGSLLAEKLNSLIDNFNPEDLGTKIGQALQNAVDFATALLDGTHFQILGEKIGTLFSNIVANISGEDIGSFLAAKWNALISFISGLVSNFPFAEIGSKFGEALYTCLYNINWGNLFQVLAEGIKGIFTMLINLVGDYDWYELGICIGNGLNQVNWEDVLVTVAVGISNFVKGWFDLLLGFINGIDWWELTNALAEAQSKIDWAGIIGRGIMLIGLALGYGILAITKMLAMAVAQISVFVIGAIAGLVMLIVAGIWQIIKWIGELLALIFNAVVDFGVQVATWIGTFIGNIVTAVAGFVGTISEWIANLFTALFGETKVYVTDSEGQLTGDVETKKGIITGFIDTVIGFVQGLCTSITNIISSLWTTITTATAIAWQGICNFVVGIWNTISSTISRVIGVIKTTISTVWTGIKMTTTTIWNTVSTFLSTTWTNIETSVTTAFSTLSTTVINLWNDIKTGIITVVDKVKEVINGFVKTIKDVYDKITGFISGITEAVSNAWNAVTGFFGGGETSVSVTNVSAYASGGFPHAGELFVAREAGAEMVGSIGNRTAVANNDQIVQGIYEGVLSAMRDAGGATDIGVNVYLDGKQITSAVEKYQRQRGATIYTGGVVNAV